MVLRTLALFLSFFLLKGGVLDFFFAYPFLEESPMAFYPAEGAGQFFLNGRKIPSPLFHIPQPFFPFPYRMDQQGRFWSLTGSKKEVLLGWKGDFSLRWFKEDWGLEIKTFDDERGRYLRLTGFKEGAGGLIFWDAGRRKGLFTGRWEDWFVLSYSGGSQGLYARGFRLEGTGGFSGANLGGWVSREGALRGNLKWEAGASFDAFYGLQEGYSQEFKLEGQPFVKWEVEDSHYFPWILSLRAGLKGEWKNLAAGLGIQAGAVNGGPWVHPYAYLFLRRGALALHLSLKGVMPPVEGLRGIDRGGGAQHLYTWDNGWVPFTTLQPPAWKGRPGPFTRARIRLFLGRPTSLFAGLYFIRDWRLPEDEGQWEAQEEMEVYFGESSYSVWSSQGLKGYSYGNFSSLWRQGGGIFTGAGFRWGGLRGRFRISYFSSRGTYPFLPLSLRPGEIFPSSTSLMDNRNWEPAYRDTLEGELPQSNGFSLFTFLSWRLWRFRLQGFAFGFRDFPVLDFLRVYGLSQGPELVLVNREEGKYNILGALRISYSLPWGGLVLEAHGLSLRRVFWTCRINGQEEQLLAFPSWRVFLGFYLQ